MNAATTIFQEEILADTWDELLPLLQAHYQELTWRKDKFVLDPDIERYRKLESAGAIRFYTMRRDGILLGYACYVLAQNLHYKSVRMAVNDVLYVSPEARGRDPITFLRYCEAQLMDDGVKCATLHIKKWKDWGRLAAHEGYDEVETNHMKWLGD